MPQISFIKYKDILEARRFDAEYFKPEYLEIEKKIAKFPSQLKLKNIIHPTEFVRIYENEGIHILLAQNIRDNFLDFSNKAYASVELKSAIYRNKLEYNNVLMTRSGANFGQTASFKEYDEIYACADVLIIKSEGFLGGYLATYLNTKYGKGLIHRGSYGLAQPHIAPSYLYKLQIPKFSSDFEILIDTIINNSIQKQTESKQLYCEAEELILKELGLLNYDVKHSLWFSTTKKEIDNAKRYDSEYFQPKYDAIIKKIEEYEGGWDYVKNQFKQNTKLSKKVGEYCNYIEISDVNTSNGEISSNKVETKDIPANGKRKLFENDLLISKVRPYRGAVSFIDFNVDNLIGSGAFTVLQEKTNYKKEVLMIFLKTQFIKDLLLRYNCGTSYPVIKDEDILNLKIPLIKSEIQEEIAKKIQESYKLRKESKEHLEEAKRKVEEEIEK